MTFHPDGSITDGNATIVASFSGQVRQGADYRSELEQYRQEREIRAVMTQRHSVCG